MQPQSGGVNLPYGSAFAAPLDRARHLAVNSALLLHVPDSKPVAPCAAKCAARL